MKSFEFSGFDFCLTSQHVKAALLVSLLSVIVLVGLFFYLNHYTRRRYFTLWGTAWLFYALWLILCFPGWPQPTDDWLQMCRQWCLSLVALFLLWGSAQFLGQPTRQLPVGLFIGFLFTWSYLGAYHLRDWRQIELPISTLIGLASIHVARDFLAYRWRRRFIGAGLLAMGFLLWGLHQAVSPFLRTGELMGMAFLGAAVLQLFIAVSMIVLVLEEAQDAKEQAVREHVNLLRVTQAELERANHDLTRKNEVIRKFYQTLSHELKTPLTSSLEFISLVREGAAGPLHPTQAEYLGIAHDGCQRLGSLINDILDITRLETGKLSLHLRPLALAQLAGKTVASIQPLAAKKQITLSLDCTPDLPPIPLDEKRLTQVLLNLLNNSLKFTPAGGTIRVRVAPDPSGAQLLAVTDTGCGIPKSHFQHIFERLGQVKEGDPNNEEGLGLGLYICRQLVELHGGTIQVESEPGQGATFTVRLPTDSPVPRPKIFVVDDELSIRASLSLLLKREGFDVIAAAGGAEAVQLMNQHQPNLVILDLSMPDMDGVATLAAFRHRWGQVPVIFHTGYPDSDLLHRAMQHSPFTLLTKPCGPERLLAAIRSLLDASPAHPPPGLLTHDPLTDKPQTTS